MQAQACTPGAAGVPCISWALTIATKAGACKWLWMCVCIHEAYEGLWSWHQSVKQEQHKQK